MIIPKIYQFEVKKKIKKILIFQKRNTKTNRVSRNSIKKYVKTAA
jgi:hypothetical protein